MAPMTNEEAADILLGMPPAKRFRRQVHRILLDIQTALNESRIGMVQIDRDDIFGTVQYQIEVFSSDMARGLLGRTVLVPPETEKRNCDKVQAKV